MKNSKYLGAGFAFLLGIAVFLPASGATGGGSPVHKTAQQYITQFRGGVDFNSSEPVSGLVSGGRVDKATLSMLAKELAQGTEPVRVNVVKLLEQIGLALDTPRDDKFRIIRDHGVMRVLIVEGAAKRDAAKSAAMDIMSSSCKPSDLAAFHDIYLKSLAQPKGEYLFLAAKAKTMRARPFVDHIATLPAYRENRDFLEVARLAQAALGNTAIEDEYINALHEAQKNMPPAPKNQYYDEGPAFDGSEVAKRFEPLGLIGTRRSLLLACSYLRSTLKSYVPTVSETPVRFAALDAIRYNFPDERVLFEPQNVTQWAAAERFCTEHLGAVFDGPTPDLPRHQIFPTRMLGQ
jgi:hypothetical protein